MFELYYGTNRFVYDIPAKQYSTRSRANEVGRSSISWLARFMELPGILKHDYSEARQPVKCYY